ncbi:MAG: hypothetical protein Q9M34_02840, partial [Sulfurimonas sp.]|nr:hypothetical protein [Sulfurimonas sp.]
MKNYGMNEYQINKANEKLKFNKDFMQSNGIQLDDKIIPFSDFVANSYTNADRYIAELQHRAWSVYEFAQENNLSNIFFTLTLPSEWHPMTTKNYGKKNEKKVFNKKFGGRKYLFTAKGYKFLNCYVSLNIPFIAPVLDFSQTVDKYTPRNASKELSKMLLKLFNERSYRSIDKDRRCYFRVTEPHTDGTPHVHMSLFVPEDKKASIVKSLERLYPAPLGKIETDVNSPVSYLMKYVLKTLDDLRDEDSDITNLTLWYLYHGISRFYTSRTFVALEVYRKLNGMYTLRDLTKDYHRQDLSIYINSETKKITKIENEFGTLYTPKPVNWYDKLIDTDHTYLEADYEPLFKEKEVNPIDIIIDGEEFIYFNGEVKKPKI